MPTFKKSQGRNGLFSEQSLRNAVKDVTENKLSVREAAKVYNINRTTLGRYCRQAKEEGNILLPKKSMTSTQVSGKALHMNFTKFP